MHDKIEPTTTEEVRAFASNPNTQASLLLAIGPPIWRLISHISNVDFLLNVTGENFIMVLKFLEGPGWIALTIIGVLWLFYNWTFRDRTAVVTRRGPNWPLLASSIIVAFLFGVLTAINSTGAVPQTIMGWGSGDPRICVGNVNTTRLATFRKDYKVALVCGFQDVSKDKLEDENISVSNAFTITGGAVAIQMTTREGMQKRAAELSEQAKAAAGGQNVTVQIPTWYDVILLPNDVPPSKITKLADVLSFKGKILNPQYFN
jgi:hypothetical protein